jgi:AraC-like DNA-binding protein
VLIPPLESLARRLRSIQRTRSAPWLHRPPTYSLPAFLTGFGCEVQNKGSYDWPGQKRPEFALWQYTLAGEGRLTYHGTTHVVRPGTAMVLFFPDDNRYWLPEGLHWEHFYLCLGGREILPVWKEVAARRGPLLELPASSPSVMRAAELCERGLRGQFTSIYETSAESYALAMALLQDTAPGGGPAAGELARAVEFCREHLAEDIGVSDMARAAGYSRYHFTRLFKQAHGLSPNDFLIDLRVSTAARLLRDPRATVKAVAKSCGFADPAYFCKVFRKSIGVSPGVFRDSGMYSG